MSRSWVIAVMLGLLLIVPAFAAPDDPPPQATPTPTATPAPETSPSTEPQASPTPETSPQTSPSPTASPKPTPIPYQSPSRDLNRTAIPPYSQFPSGVPIHFTGMIQGQSDSDGLRATSAATHFPETNGIGTFPANTDFYIRRLRLALQGNAYKDMYFNVEGNYESKTGRPTLINMYADFRPQDGMFFEVGTFKTRFGIEGLRNDYLGDIIELSDMTNCLYANGGSPGSSGGRDIGANYTYRGGDFVYSIGAYNGQGQRVSQFALRQYIGKVDFLVSKNFYVGASFDYGTTLQPTSQVATLRSTPFVNPAPRRSTTAAAARPAPILPAFTVLPVRKVGFEFHYFKKPWLVEGEYMNSTGWNSFAKNVAQAAGFYVRTVYTASKQIDLMINYDKFNPDTNNVNDVTPSNSINGRERYVAGVNYYFDRKTVTKLMLDYEWHNQTTGKGYNASGFRVRYQFRF